VAGNPRRNALFGVVPFEHLTGEECIEVEKELIGLINEHALLGLAVAVNEADYDTWFEKPN